MDQNVKGALVRAIHEVRPPARGDCVRVDMGGWNQAEFVTVTFHMSPGLIKAWGDELAKSGGDMPSRSGMPPRNP